MECAEARFTARQLLSVAKGHDPPACDCIIDFDLSALPTPDPSHRDYYRIMSDRIKYETQNLANEQKRAMIKLVAWTDIYTSLKTCTEKTAPVLSQELKECCDLEKLSGVPGGFFDGPRGWRMVMFKLSNGQRSEADKDFYRTAERLQQSPRR